MPDSEGLVLPVLGLPVRFQCEDERVLAAVRRNLGFWDHIAVAEQADGFDVTFHVEPGLRGGRTLDFEVKGDSLLELNGSGLSCVADRKRRRGTCRLVAGWLDDDEVFRKQILEAVTLFLLSGETRVPVHASAVVLGDVAAILVGESGSGKTTLAYAAAAMGLQVLAEDVVYVEPTEGHRVWGAVSRFHLLPSLVGEFPELEGLEPHEMADGRSKLIVEPSAPMRAVVPVRRSVLCVLRVDCEAVSWHALGDSNRVLAGQAVPGFDLHRDQAARSLRRLAAQGAIELELTTDARAGAAAVAQILRIHTQHS